MDVRNAIIASISLKEHTSTDSYYMIFNHYCEKENKRQNSDNCQHCIDLIARMKTNDSSMKEKRKIDEVTNTKKELKQLSSANKKLKIKNNDKSKENKALKRKLKADRIRLAKATSKVQTFMSNSPGIYIKSLNEAKKWEALCMLAYERCERYYFYFYHVITTLLIIIFIERVEKI